MLAPIEIKPVTTRRELAAFVKFPWRVYQGDHNWVPPLISDQMDYLDRQKNPFFSTSDVILYTASRNRELVGTIAAFVDRPMIANTGEVAGGFGFFEVLEDFEAAKALLDAACAWLRLRNMPILRGPTNFTDNDNPGVLIEGADCPPVMMEAHNPPYYQELLEKYGMEKDHDLYAWRAFRSQIGEELKNIPPDLARVAEAARKAAGVTIRKIRMDHWDEEIDTALYLFNETLKRLPDFNPLSKEEFQRLAGRMRSFIDPDLALFAQKEAKAVGFCVAIPDLNQILIHLNGRLYPFNWIRVPGLIKKIDVVSFKLMGLLEEYRHRGIDAILYLEVVKAIYEKGYAWMDGSITSEYNPAVNLLANRLGAERYKHYRIYKITL